MKPHSGGLPLTSLNQSSPTYDELQNQNDLSEPSKIIITHCRWLAVAGSPWCTVLITSNVKNLSNQNMNSQPAYRLDSGRYLLRPGL